MEDKKNLKIFECKAINSTVLKEDEIIGHVLLSDYDDTPVSTIIEENGGREGINLILESSKDKFHYYNLTVKSLDEVSLEKLELHEDSKHNAIGYKRKKHTLRFGKKVNGDEKIKPFPDFHSCWVNETDKPQSLPHFNILKSCFPPFKWKMNTLHIDKFDFIGEGLQFVAYMSYETGGKDDG